MPVVRRVSPRKSVSASSAVPAAKARATPKGKVGASLAEGRGRPSRVVAGGSDVEIMVNGEDDEVACAESKSDSTSSSSDSTSSSSDDDDGTVESDDEDDDGDSSAEGRETGSDSDVQEVSAATKDVSRNSRTVNHKRKVQSSRTDVKPEKVSSVNRLPVRVAVKKDKVRASQVVKLVQRPSGISKSTCRYSGEFVGVVDEGNVLAYDHFQESGFRWPILVKSIQGLPGLKVPSVVQNSSTVTQVRVSSATLNIYSDDVSRRTRGRPTVFFSITEWKNYWAQLLSVQSGVGIEGLRVPYSTVFGVPLLGEPGGESSTPDVVRQLDWGVQVWPEVYKAYAPSIAEEPVLVKEEMLYRQSAPGSLLDFSISPGGSSSWRHVLRGSLTLWMIPPTDAHLIAYCMWVRSVGTAVLLPGGMKHSLKTPPRFFAEALHGGACQKLIISEGETLLTPTGWIVASLAGTDSVVEELGGRFLHGLNIPLQLKVYELLESLANKGHLVSYYVDTPAALSTAFLSMHWLALAEYLLRLTRFLYIGPFPVCTKTIEAAGRSSRRLVDVQHFAMSSPHEELSLNTAIAEARLTSWERDGLNSLLKYFTSPSAATSVNAALPQCIPQEGARLLNDATELFSRLSESRRNPSCGVPLLGKLSQELDSWMESISSSLTNPPPTKDMKPTEFTPAPLTNKPAPLPVTAHVVEPGRKRTARCGQCPGCKTTDCRKCDNCRDMLKYGGPGTKKQACMARECHQRKVPAQGSKQRHVPWDRSLGEKSAAFPELPGMAEGTPPVAVPVATRAAGKRGKDMESEEDFKDVKPKVERVQKPKVERASLLNHHGGGYGIPLSPAVAPTRPRRKVVRNDVVDKEIQLSLTEKRGVHGECTRFNVVERLTSSQYDHKLMVIHGNGATVTYRAVVEGLFNRPLLVQEKKGLELEVPNVDVRDVTRLVGPDRITTVVDVNTQSALEMRLVDWETYWFGARKSLGPQGQELGDRLLNIISLEVSHTALDSKIVAPSVVRQLDWVESAWPLYLKYSHRESSNAMSSMLYPKVQKYCLMSVKGSYTDFHVDFGGTSVWYHVIRGEKVFWLIPPTDANLKLFRDWTLSADQASVFFADGVDQCQRVSLKPGHTFFIPAGWIHAVYTPEDSLVFGGNFLNSFTASEQFSILDVEVKTHVERNSQFPFFWELNWYVIVRYYERLTGQKAAFFMTTRKGEDTIEEQEVTSGLGEGDIKGEGFFMSTRELRSIELVLAKLQSHVDKAPKAIREPRELLVMVLKLIRSVPSYEESVKADVVPILGWSANEKTVWRSLSDLHGEVKVADPTEWHKGVAPKDRTLSRRAAGNRGADDSDQDPDYQAVAEEEEEEDLVLDNPRGQGAGRGRRGGAHRGAEEGSLMGRGAGIKKKVRCRVCEGCKAPPCETCVYCLDSPRFGGFNRLKQACKSRRCTQQGYSQAHTQRSRGAGRGRARRNAAASSSDSSSESSGTSRSQSPDPRAQRGAPALRGSRGRGRPVRGSAHPRGELPFKLIPFQQEPMRRGPRVRGGSFGPGRRGGERRPISRQRQILNDSFVLSYQHDRVAVMKGYECVLEEDGSFPEGSPLRDLLEPLIVGKIGDPSVPVAPGIKPNEIKLVDNVIPDGDYTFVVHRQGFCGFMHTKIRYDVGGMLRALHGDMPPTQPTTGKRNGERQNADGSDLPLVSLAGSSVSVSLTQGDGPVVATVSSKAHGMASAHVSSVEDPAGKEDPSSL